ncbi:hypothetical protein [Pseudomonas putida]|uniref:hypothetical protein n=1 Tax=Pseudomonas putida TaxID=303 RepID=UPI003F894E12
MAMYDLEDVGEAELKRSETTGEQLVKGKRIGKLVSEDAKAGVPCAEKPVPKSWRAKALNWVTHHAMSIFTAVVAALISALLLSYFGLP